MEGYIGRYKRLCYTSSLDDKGTVYAMGDIVETLRKEAWDLARVSRMLWENIKGGKPVDGEYIWLAGEAAGILEAIEAYGDRLKSKVRRTA